jgi:aldehyde dehydrogenase (NAD+)
MSPPKLSYTPIAEIPKIHDTVVDTFASRLTFPLEFREHQLLQFARLIKENKDLLARALWDDLGRPALEAYQTEIGPLFERALIFAKQLRTWAAPEDKTDEVPDWQKDWKVQVFKQPKGAVLAIAPWNYPVILSFQPLLGAIAAGCCCVVKPSELAPAVSRAVSELVPKYLDNRAYRVVQGGVEETSKLLELKWDHIFYTGNGRVARIISAAAAKHLTPITLELGGKSPVIVDPKYPDLDVAAKRILWGKYCNAGQVRLLFSYYPDVHFFAQICVAPGTDTLRSSDGYTHPR